MSIAAHARTTLSHGSFQSMAEILINLLQFGNDSG